VTPNTSSTWWLFEIILADPTSGASTNDHCHIPVTGINHPEAFDVPGKFISRRRVMTFGFGNAVAKGLQNPKSWE
jgi:hypothetical protein